MSFTERVREKAYWCLDSLKGGSVSKHYKEVHEAFSNGENTKSIGLKKTIENSKLIIKNENEENTDIFSLANFLIPCNTKNAEQFFLIKSSNILITKSQKENLENYVNKFRKINDKNMIIHNIKLNSPGNTIFNSSKNQKFRRVININDKREISKKGITEPKENNRYIKEIKEILQERETEEIIKRLPPLIKKYIQYYSNSKSVSHTDKERLTFPNNYVNDFINSLQKENSYTARLKQNNIKIKILENYIIKRPNVNKTPLNNKKVQPIYSTIDH